MSEVLDKEGFKVLVKEIDRLLMKSTESVSNTPEIIRINNPSNIVVVEDIPLCSYVIITNPVKSLTIDLSNTNKEDNRKNIIYIQFKTSSDEPEISFVNDVLWSTEYSIQTYNQNTLYRFEISLHPSKENTLLVEGY